MATQCKAEFLEEFRALCEKYKCYIDAGYGKPLYVMEIFYPVDDEFESVMNKLYKDIGL